MSGVRQSWSYPVLKNGDTVAVKDEDKAALMVKAIANVHSSLNLTDDERHKRAATKRQYQYLLENVEDQDASLNASFSVSELKKAISKVKVTATGKDRISYAMLKHLSNEALNTVLELFNKVWDQGKIPKSWKMAVIIPIRKPGKDPTVASSYRPIALSSHLGKVMERMIVERMTFYVESRNLITPFQSGFRKGRSTMDPVIKMESDIRNAQVCKEVVAAIFFDVEKTYDMLWKDGVLI